MKPVKLKNLYTKEIVFTENYEEIVQSGEIEFIYVYKEETPQRKYLANKNAFEILNNKWPAPNGLVILTCLIRRNYDYIYVTSTSLHDPWFWTIL